MDLQDVIIIGGGPAGLNAAVVLGRCRRKVLVFDTAQQRNRWSHGMHNYLTQDGILPTDFIKICQEEIKRYGVQLQHKRIIKARRNDDGIFVVRTEDEVVHYAKKLLIATGLADNVPPIEGFLELYGKSVFHCPYCDGWEVRDQKLGVYAKNKNGGDLAMALKGWSPHVTLYTDGGHKLKPKQEEQLAALSIPVVRLPIARLIGKGDKLQKVAFKNGEMRDCDALFFVNGYTQQCNLAETFDCEVSSKGVIVTNRFQQTSTPGLYVAGDADKDMHLVVVAASEGAKAGVTINKELQKEINDNAIAAYKAKQIDGAAVSS